jgi:choline-sulfatase
MNVIFILSDQHNPAFTGCYGGVTRTPNLDALAASGARFAGAYTNNPLCTPSRAALMTSRYAHEVFSFDNTSPYDGKLPGWGHYFRERQIQFTTIGKLDLAPDADLGIDDARSAKYRASLSVAPLFRDEPVEQRETFNSVKFDGQGGVTTSSVDKEAHITEQAIHWLKQERPQDRPWVLNVNYHRPHPKWLPDPDLFAHYKATIAPPAGKYVRNPDDLHEADRALGIATGGFDIQGEEMRLAQAAYHAMTESLDKSIGQLLQVVDDLELREQVLIVYASDHGEMAGAHGKWNKTSPHEDSIRVPLIVSGPGIAAGTVIPQPVSLIDVYPTINEALGQPPAPFSRGRSVMRLAQTGQDDERIDYVFSESHSGGMIAGTFVIRRGDWKLIEYVGYRPSLYNLREDPDEMHDYMAGSPVTGLSTEVEGKLTELRGILGSICLPEGIDRLARRQQRNLRKQLAATGQLFREQLKRGYEPNAEHLIPMSAGKPGKRSMSNEED